jgi:nucleotide-binding universal stress UspA family protein
MCPQELAAELPVMFGHVLIASDHSAPAARAVADALPMLQSAETVHIITATDKRMPQEMESGAALVDHLAEHGINAVFEAVKIDGSSIEGIRGLCEEARDCASGYGCLSPHPSE